MVQYQQSSDDCSIFTNQTIYSQFAMCLKMVIENVYSKFIQQFELNNKSEIIIIIIIIISIIIIIIIIRPVIIIIIICFNGLNTEFCIN